MSAFHWRDGWWFTRHMNGDVEIRRDGYTKALVPADEWASIVHAVAAPGADYYAVKRMLAAAPSTQPESGAGPVAMEEQNEAQPEDDFGPVVITEADLVQLRPAAQPLDVQPEREPAPQWFVDEVRQSVGTILNAPDAETEAKREVAEANHLWAAALRAPLGDRDLDAVVGEIDARITAWYFGSADPDGAEVRAGLREILHRHLYRTPQERSNGTV